MKDRVFIAWSGSNKEAIEVKKILESRFNYVCSIGGNAENNSSYSSVGDTVIQQIKSCNQAIVIFQKREDGAVSNNLFFELGYVLAMYGTKKIHCVKKNNESVILPSDFDNSFVEPIKEDEEHSFAEGIVEYFMSRQKMSINENKMYLMNNRYLLHDKIKSHYSETGSKCSDYELAQYILFYMQAAHMFGDEKKIQKEILEFKQAHSLEFSTELSIAVNMCLSFFDMVLNIKAYDDTSEVYIDKDVFWKFKNDYVHYSTLIKDDDIGVFDEWANVMIYEQLTFSYMLFANNEENDSEMKRQLNEICVKNAFKAIECIKILEDKTPSRENNDVVGLVSLYKAYVYRNLFLAKEYLGDEDAKDWLKKTLDERTSLKNNFGRGTVDTQLYNNFCLEYYLSLTNYLSFTKDISEFDKKMYKTEIKEYLLSVKKESNENAFLKQISKWSDKD